MAQVCLVTPSVAHLPPGAVILHTVMGVYSVHLLHSCYCRKLSRHSEVDLRHFILLNICVKCSHN